MVLLLVFSIIAAKLSTGTFSPSVVHAFGPQKPRLQHRYPRRVNDDRRAGRKGQTRHKSTMTAASLEENDSSYSRYSASWTDLSPDALVAAPCLIEQTLCQPPSIMSGGQPQLAASVNHAKALLEAWREEQVESETTNGRLWHDTEWQRVQYHDCHGTALYGHWIRPKRRFPIAESLSPPTSSTVILLFSTAAGPHDLFLLWKATSLIHTLSDFDGESDNCRDIQVLIADVVSDETGWGWDMTDDGRFRYSAARDELLRYTSCKKPMNDSVAFASSVDDGTGQQRKRSLLQDRITAALNFVQTNIVPSRNDDATTATDTDIATDATSEPQEAKPQRPPISLAALGWCLGGQAIAELAVMIKQEQKQWQQQQENANAKSKRAPSLTSAIRGMATFHGVFAGLDDSVLALPVNGDSGGGHVGTNAEILLCHGMKDPFVPPSDVGRALALFQKCGHTTSLLQLKDAKHGFTNPAQEFNTNTDAFGYHQESADKAWRQTLALLRRRLL